MLQKIAIFIFKALVTIIFLVIAICAFLIYIAINAIPPEASIPESNQPQAQNPWDFETNAKPPRGFDPDGYGSPRSDDTRPGQPDFERPGRRSRDAYLAPPSPFDENTIINAEVTRTGSTGTAFAISNNGLWMTAKHVAYGCDQIRILSPDGRKAVIAQTQYVADMADVAILRTLDGPQAVKLDLDETDIVRTTQGFHVGFPQGKPGEVVSTLIGRELMTTRGAWRGKEQTLAWAERARTSGLRGTLGGLSGGPTFDAAGNVVGITIAEEPRRGRVITTSANSLTSALGEAGIVPDGENIGTISVQQFSQTAQRLRGSLRVAQVVCLMRRR